MSPSTPKAPCPEVSARASHPTPFQDKLFRATTNPNDFWNTFLVLGQAAQHMGSSFPNRDQSTPCTGSVKSEPLDHQGSPRFLFFKQSKKKKSIPVAQMVKNPPPMQETKVWSLGQEDPLEKRNDKPFQYSCLENSMDRGAWQATVHGVANGLTWLSD